VTLFDLETKQPVPTRLSDQPSRIARLFIEGEPKWEIHFKKAGEQGLTPALSPNQPETDTVMPIVCSGGPEQVAVIPGSG
jgi:hypothetical protein